MSFIFFILLAMLFSGVVVIILPGGDSDSASGRPWNPWTSHEEVKWDRRDEKEKI